MKDHNKEDKTKLIGKHNILLQDNTSTIQLERFGRGLARSVPDRFPSDTFTKLQYAVLLDKWNRGKNPNSSEALEILIYIICYRSN